MAAGKAPMTLGYGLYGLSIILIALVSLAFGDFDPGHPVPKAFPARTALAYVEALFLLVAGAAVLWRRTTALAGEVLVAYYTLIVVILMNGRVVLRNLTIYGAYIEIRKMATKTARTPIACHGRRLSISGLSNPGSSVRHHHKAACTTPIRAKLPA